MRYGYCRVSTLSQKDNTSLAEQEKAIKELYADAVIVNETYSGAKQRKEFDALLARLEEGDLVVCTKLDRFCRTAKEGLEYIDQILDKGCSIHILNMGLVDNSPMGRMMVTMLLAFAEFERAQIIERTQAGREVAMQSPTYQNGRPMKYDADRRRHAIKLLEEHSFTEVEKMTGISKSTLKRYARKIRKGEMKL